MNEEMFTGKLWKWSGRIVLFALAIGLLQVGRASLLYSNIARVVFIWSFIGEVLIAMTLVFAISKTQLRRLDLAVLVWFVLFVVQQFSNIVEGLFFTSLYSSTAYLVQSVLTSLVTTFVEGVLAAVLFKPTRHDMSLVAEFSSYFEKRSARSWLWRIGVGSVVYFPIYFFFGALISPFVIPYYSNSSFGLRIPSFTVMIPLEFFRGFLYVLSLLGVFAAVKATRRTMSLIAASILYVPGGLVALMLAIATATLPLAIIPFHMTEILADSLAYGAVLTYLFRVKLN